MSEAMIHQRTSDEKASHKPYVVATYNGQKPTEHATIEDAMRAARANAMSGARSHICVVVAVVETEVKVTQVLASGGLLVGADFPKPKPEGAG